MKKFGGYLFFFGIGSMILHGLQREFIILAWINMWGETVGWAIRSAMVGLGALLWIVGMVREKNVDEAPVRDLPASGE